MGIFLTVFILTLFLALFSFSSVAIFHLQFVLTLLVFEVPKIEQTKCQASIKKKKKERKKGQQGAVVHFYDLEISRDISRLLRCSSVWWIDWMSFSPQLQRVSAGKRNN